MKLVCGIFILLFVVPAQSLAAVADLIIINANVRTMTSAQPKAEAIAVSNGEIIAVGSSEND
jgi:hypothetical protein